MDTAGPLGSPKAPSPLLSRWALGPQGKNNFRFWVKAEVAPERLLHVGPVLGHAGSTKGTPGEDGKVCESSVIIYPVPALGPVGKACLKAVSPPHLLLGSCQE